MAKNITKAELVAQLDALRHKLAQLELDNQILRDKLADRDDAAAERAAIQAESAAPVAQAPAASRRSTAPRRCHTLVVNGIERLGSWDYAYLARVARDTKLAYPNKRVEVRAC